MFPGGNIKISNVLKISPQLRAVPLGLRYQGNGSSINCSVFSSKRNGSGWTQKVTDESLPATAGHQLTQASAKVGQPTCNDNNNMNICLGVRRWRSGKIVLY